MKTNLVQLKMFVVVALIVDYVRGDRRCHRHTTQLIYFHCSSLSSPLILVINAVHPHWCRLDFLVFEREAWRAARCASGIALNEKRFAFMEFLCFFSFSIG